MTDTNEIVTLLKGSNVDISCTSSGGPIPTVAWIINNSSTDFSQTDVITNPTDETTPGYVVSTLHVVNAQFPEHNGMFICTGTNIISGTPRTDSANIILKIQCKLTTDHFKSGN